uniref:N-acetyltransferase domain-containing protein n=1 Tax=Globisporangium ultimum (strain ATCC 200006 / CBS 805.95 / DAOM BR144) TaxID=431595 RepID=K3WM77_GLOUD
MRANAGLVIVGKNVTLVPYEKEHVPKYHQWMTDPWLQGTLSLSCDMTASEPLSMEEEYEMQQSWREDDKKCTFIVLAKGTTNAESSFIDEAAIDRMAGDVNLFFNDYDDAFNCEMEIMIAEPKYRRKGFAKEAVELMMAYATSKLNVHRFYCKINEINHASLQLFDK